MRIVPQLDAPGFVRSKRRRQPVIHVLVAAQGVISPQKQKPQRERRGFKIQWWPGAESTEP